MRAAALGAVFALAVAGTALADERTWTGGANNGILASDDNWDPAGTPGAGDTAIFNKNAVITVLEKPSTVAELKFTGTDDEIGRAHV